MELMTHDDVMETLEVTMMRSRTAAGGAWVGGTIAGHRFSALVFSQPAVNRQWEVNTTSRISKLWVQRLDDGVTVYNWDRGLDVAPRTDLAARIVALLAEGLADLVWGLTVL
ncbi:hypothetical protein RAS2_09860 [Phycisphaerae bacterium RAS2]|nr:hypothetical protein RAS2_09860 [Phycisphaerae bacterium RAS2]